MTNPFAQALREAKLDGSDRGEDQEDVDDLGEDDPDFRIAEEEATLRTKLAERFDIERKRRGLDVNALVTKAGLPKRHVRRALNKERGGSLPLRSIIKAAHALGLKVYVDVEFRTNSKPKPGFPVNGGVYRHFETGSLYTVIDVGRHTERRERLVAYRGPSGALYLRPLKLFMEDVINEAGEVVPRFDLVG